VCTRREDFGPEVDEAFEEEVRAKSNSVSPGIEMKVNN